MTNLKGMLPIEDRRCELSYVLSVVVVVAAALMSVVED